MAIDPMSAGMAGLSVLSGYLGGGEGELPPEYQRAFKRFMKMFQEMRQEGKGIPGSSPQEQAMLAQQKALAGEGLGQQYESLLASYGANPDPSAAAGLAQFRGNVAGTMAGLDMQALLQFLQNKQHLKWGGAASMLSGALGAASGPRVGGGADLSGMLGQVGQIYAQTRAYKPQPGVTINYGGAGAYGTGGQTAGGYQPNMRNDAWGLRNSLQQGFGFDKAL